MDIESIGDHIQYVVALPTKGSGVYSLFQGFSQNTLETANAIRHIASLPPTIRELFITRDEAIRWRASGLGGHAVLQIELEFIDKVRNTLPWACFVSGADTVADVERHVRAKGQLGWLHLTTADDPNVRSLWTFTRSDMYKWSRTAAEEILRQKGGESQNSWWRPFVDWPAERLRLSGRQHNITAPTEMALLSLGFELSKVVEPLVGGTDRIFAEALSDAAVALGRVRLRAVPQRRVPFAPSLVLAVPSVYRRLSADVLRREATRPARLAMRSVLRQQQYTAMRLSPDDTMAVVDDPLASVIMEGRALELRAFTAALSLTAASLAAPVLRCPPQVDRVRELLIRLGGVRGDSFNRVQKRNALAAVVGRALRASLPRPLLRHIEQEKHRSIKIIGDTPLELLPIRGLPLGLRRTTSRLPTLPGNLLMRQALLRTPLLLQPRELNRVLVVRAFQPNDELKTVLETSLAHFADDIGGRVQVQIVDVATKDDFLKAFNEFDGNLAIFDGHGQHGRGASQGTLAVGGLQFSPFELYGEIRVPPIVLLSACETHPLDGNENSVASAFLIMGARSVLGTMLPVDGVNAGILIARFIFRLAEFLPMYAVTMPWSEVVTGMLRMSYVTDVLRALGKHVRIDAALYRDAHSKANLDINTFRPDWFERFLKRLAEGTSRTETEINALWCKHAYFTDTMRYVHLGQPEHVFVVPDRPDPIQAR